MRLRSKFRSCASLPVTNRLLRYRPSPAIPEINVASTAFASALSSLKAHRHQHPIDIRRAFTEDAARFGDYSLTLGDLLLDWSKCAVNDETMRLLAEFALAAGVEQSRDAMFAGDKINITERRAVLHTALRAPRDAVIDVDGRNVVPDVHAVLDAMGAFADAVRDGEAAGATAKKITDIVNIGIGGSDLGPVMATLALSPYHDGPRAHFVSNIDGAHIRCVARELWADGRSGERGAGSREYWARSGKCDA
jgi:glucose-6-phosphate isomerase